MINLPKYLLADNTDFPEKLFVIHTEFPRFILDVENDDIEWLEDYSKESEEGIQNEIEKLYTEAQEFFERELSRYENEEI